MKTSITPDLRNTLSLGLAGLLAGLCASACDLPDKDLGADPMSTTGDSGTAGDDGPCVDGDTKMEDCNTCTCEGGSWSCTEIACGDESGGNACDPNDLPDCGDCSCEDGLWVCTAIGCDPTGGSDTGVGECDPDEEPDDGCNGCLCQDGTWTCTANVCPDSPPVGICDGTEVVDPFTILDAAVMDHELLLTVQYSGGCATHDFGTCWDEAFLESEPVQVGLLISHEDNVDFYDAAPTEMLAFDLSPVRNAWIDAYQQLSGTITLNVAGWGSIDYTF